MYEEVQVLTHSSIRIAGNQIIYFDPFHVEEETHDADIICVTHEHFDHYSPEDLAKVKNAATILVCPKSMKDSLSNSGISEEFTELVAPGDELEINNLLDQIPTRKVEVFDKTKGFSFFVNLDLSDNEVEVVLSGGQLRFLKKQLAAQEK